MDTTDYIICTHYASALINDDWSGLEDHEAAELRAFIDRQPGGYFTIPDIGADGFFARDEVSGLMADCIDMQLIKYNAE